MFERSVSKVTLIGKDKNGTNRTVDRRHDNSLHVKHLGLRFFVFEMSGIKLRQRVAN